MRRPRSKLQVSTFPFLAVLLCAMGALLLFLFMMDRRAKIVSQNRARQAIETMVAKKIDTQAERDARQAEWEQAKEKLRGLLLAQQESLQADSKNVEQNLLDADRLLEIATARLLDLQPKLGSEAAKIATMQSQIERERNDIKSADLKEEATKLERTKATLELAELTIAFQELKARRSNEKDVYSLVPYRGKRGDQRAPIYVECTRDGVLFHPERKLLHGLEFTMAAVRSEVERRTGPLLPEKSEREKSRTAPKEKTEPYVLFLIRPDGIANYYKTQAGLRGLQLDFGYELVDESWVLDFGGSALATQKPPDLRPVPPPILGSLPPRSGQGSGGSALQMAGAGSNSGTPGGSAPLPGANSIKPSFGNPAGGSGSPTPNPGMGLGYPDASSGSPVPNRSGGYPAIEGQPSIGLTVPVMAPREPAFVPVSKLPTANPGVGGGFQPSLVASAGLPAQMPDSRQALNTKPIGAANPTGKSGQPTQPETGNQGSAIQGGNSPNGNPPNAATQTPSSPPGLGANAPTEAIINQGTSLPGVTAPAPRKSAVPLGRALGNKDFVITIDCFTDHITIFPSGVQFRWTAQTMRETDQAAVQTIVKLIERRQAAVREGEAPYRPVLRFQVSPQGLRTYYHVYPLFEHLHIPWTRENVED